MNLNKRPPRTRQHTHTLVTSTTTVVLSEQEGESHQIGCSLIIPSSANFIHVLEQKWYWEVMNASNESREKRPQETLLIQQCSLKVVTTIAIALANGRRRRGEKEEEKGTLVESATMRRSDFFEVGRLLQNVNAR